MLYKVENADTFDNAKKSHSLKKVDCDGQQKVSLSPASLYGAKPKSPTGKAGDGNTYKYSASS